MASNRPNSGPDRRGIDVSGPEEGRPIAFVHGAMFTRHMWAPQRDALADEFRVVAPDVPGHGARADEQFRFDRGLEVVDSCLAAETDEPALLVGLSLGGYLATAYAARNPDAVDGLVLSGSSANPVGGLEPLTRATGGVSRLATRPDRLERGVARLGKRWVRARGLDPTHEAEIVEAGIYPRPFGDAGREIAGTDFRGALGAYPGPTLICNGQKDLVMRRGEDAHAEAAQDGRVEVLEGAGHVCNLHRPDAYTATIRRFARRVERSRTL